MTKYGFSPYSSTIVDPPTPFLVQSERGLGFRGHDGQHPGVGCGVKRGSRGRRPVALPGDRAPVIGPERINVPFF